MSIASKVTAFNNKLRTLFTCLEAANKGNALVIDAKNRATTAINASELAAIQNIGPVLFKYKDKIIAGNAEYFLNHTFEEFTEFKDIVDKAKQTWKSCKENERAALQGIIKDMTVLYVEYVLIEKKASS